jgi:squalene-associated FAD-dependent desaturase
MPHAHVVGAGLSGLAAALSLARAGWGVTLYESGPAAGGRCRSYFDRELGCRIDNGNHLLLSGNSATMAYLQQIGAVESLTGPAEPRFAFVDVGSDERWLLRLSRGRVPWWLFNAQRRVPDTRMRDYLALLRLPRDGTATVADVLDDGGALYARLLKPLAIAALNTPPDAGLAKLLRRVVAETLLRGGAACRPLVPRVGLSESFVDPALAWLQAHSGIFHSGRRIVALRIERERIAGLQIADAAVGIGRDDAVVLAVPPPVAADLLPGLRVPDEFCAIVNVHFRVATDPGTAGLIGVIGGAAEWVFVKPGIVSVTISAANRFADAPAEEIAGRVWQDVRTVLQRDEAMPPVRVVKERRATFAATAAQERLRPSARTALANLALAGDWTATGLPATIEGAVRSGRAAAEVLLSR